MTGLRTGFSPKDMHSIECDVVVVCSAFNQENVIHEALEGFVSQSTSFSFVVLVHDDASTDSTAQIIKDYAKQYPALIKGIYESENQFQRGEIHWYLDYFRETNARFVALCEGDDYWTVDNKLEIQYSALVSNPECSFCFTNAFRVDSSSGKIVGEMLPAYPWEESLLNKKKLDTIDLLKITFLPTASFFARREAWLLEPDLPREAFRGDRAHQLFLSLNGPAYYLDAITCAYRVNNPNSQMGHWANSDIKMNSILDSYIELYVYLDKYTNYQYHNALQEAIELKLYDKMLLTGKKGLVSKKIAYKIARERGLSGLIKYRLFCSSPAIYHIVRKLGRSIRPRPH